MSMTRDGKQRRDDALALLELHRRRWVRGAREWAIGYAQQHGSVTVDDVRRGYPPPPDGCDGRVYGAVFNTKDLVAVDFVLTTVPSSNRRPIRRFKVAPGKRRPMPVFGYEHGGHDAAEYLAEIRKGAQDA